MAVFDILKAKAKCPFCGHKQDWMVLYRYGDCLEREKKTGDKIIWSVDSLRFYDYGENVGGHVQIHGEVDSRCSACKSDPLYSIISIRDNVIEGIELFAKPIEPAKPTKPTKPSKRSHQRT
jgi:hypothetical protein